MLSNFVLQMVQYHGVGSRALGSFLAPNLWVLYGAQGLQMFGFALFAVASVYYVNELIDEKDRVKGQAYVTMTMSVGTVIGSFLGGYLIDCVSVPGMLLVATLSAGIGAIGVFFFTEPVKKR